MFKFKFWRGFSAVVMVLGFKAHGQALDITGGLRMNQSKSSGYSNETRYGLQGGAYYYFELAPQAAIRTGGLLVMRNGELKSSFLDAKAERMFLDVPAQFYYLADPVGLFIGFNLGLKMSSSSSCSGSLAPLTNCELVDEESTVIQPIMGAEFKIDKFKLGFAYEFETKYSRQWKQSAFVLTFGWPLRTN